jgi:DinB superfamily
MSETVVQYMQRLEGYVKGQQPLKIQASTAKKIERLLKGAPAAKLRKRPAADKWSVADVITHLADNEVICGTRLRMILGAPGSAIPAYDQNSWATSLHYEKRDARQSLEQFRAVRDANLALLKTLTPEQWKHHGVHPERGVETIEHIVTLVAGHDVNHLKQIERTLAPAKKRGK